MEDKIINVNSLLYEEFAAEGDPYVTETPAPTTPAPTTPAPTTPAPTPAPCQCCSETKVPVYYEHCQLTATQPVTTTLECVGRFLNVDVTLRDVCPNQFVNIGVLIYENDTLIAFKVCRLFTDSTPDVCIPYINAGRFCFVFDEQSCPPARTLKVRIIAHYVFGQLDS